LGLICFLQRALFLNCTLASVATFYLAKIQEISTQRGRWLKTFMSQNLLFISAGSDATDLRWKYVPFIGHF